MFILSNVEKIYGNIVALCRVRARIASDGFTFILGPSGSGKSTLIRLLGFVETPDRGAVILNLNGQHFDSRDVGRPWPLVTCVFQRQFLWPHLSLRTNIGLPLRAQGSSDVKARVENMIDLFDMSKFVDRLPNQVSGGEAQRAALARAFALQPSVIIIDEAHTGLDLEQQQILNAYLLKLRERGAGLILVTHSLGFAHRYADQVIVVERGTIAEVGSRDVFTFPKSAFLQRVLRSKQAGMI